MTTGRINQVTIFGEGLSLGSFENRKRRNIPSEQDSNSRISQTLRIEGQD
jgi:hypothetical protein